MDTTDFTQIYRFLTESRARFLIRFRELGWDEVAKDRGASWNSMLGIFIHLLDVEESWLHYPAKPWPAPSPHLEQHVVGNTEGAWEIDPLSFRTIEAVETYHETVAEKTRSLLAGLTRESLEEEFPLEGNGKGVKGSMRHILFHAFLDEVAHLGELVCLLWQIEEDPNWMSWLDLYRTSVG